MLLRIDRPKSGSAGNPARAPPFRDTRVRAAPGTRQKKPTEFGYGRLAPWVECDPLSNRCSSRPTIRLAPDQRRDLPKTAEYGQIPAREPGSRTQLTQADAPSAEATQCGCGSTSSKLATQDRSREPRADGREPDFRR